MQRNSLIHLILLVSCTLAACTAPSNKNSAASETKSTSTSAGASTSAISEPNEAAGGKVKVNPLGSESARKLCQAIDTGDFPILNSQTFAINFEPFRESCFVTTHNPEYDDPPMDSVMTIFKNDKKILELPDQFNGVTTGCWVEGVAFQDINNDDKIDVVVAGKCSAKTAPYNENMIYLNDGKTLLTNLDANSKISEYSTLKQIIDYASEHPETFPKK